MPSKLERERHWEKFLSYVGEGAVKRGRAADMARQKSPPADSSQRVDAAAAGATPLTQ